MMWAGLNQFARHIGDSSYSLYVYTKKEKEKKDEKNHNISTFISTRTCYVYHSICSNT